MPLKRKEYEKPPLWPIQIRPREKRPLKAPDLEPVLDDKSETHAEPNDKTGLETPSMLSGRRLRIQKWRCDLPSESRCQSVNPSSFFSMSAMPKASSGLISVIDDPRTLSFKVHKSEYRAWGCEWCLVFQTKPSNFQSHRIRISASASPSPRPASISAKMLDAGPSSWLPNELLQSAQSGNVAAAAGMRFAPTHRIF